MAQVEDMNPWSCSQKHRTVYTLWLSATAFMLPCGQLFGRARRITGSQLADFSVARQHTSFVELVS